MECQDPGESHAFYQVKLVNECILIALRCYGQSCLESFIQMASEPLSGWLRLSAFTGYILGVQNDHASSSRS